MTSTTQSCAWCRGWSATSSSTPASSSTAAPLDFLDARIALDRARLDALFPGDGRDIDVDTVEHALSLVPRICAGDPAAGPIAALSRSERFHWLVAPRSTIAQVSPVHSGLCDDPAAMLDHLVDAMVRVGKRAR